MHEYELRYDYAGGSFTRRGATSQRIDSHDLLIELMKTKGKFGQFVRTKSSKESLRLMRFTNVRVNWL
jgi:hypothetical protein